jgi:hypothetical protein
LPQTWKSSFIDRQPNSFDMSGGVVF